MTIGINSPD